MSLPGQSKSLGMKGLPVIGWDDVWAHKYPRCPKYPEVPRRVSSSTTSQEGCAWVALTSNDAVHDHNVHHHVQVIHVFVKPKAQGERIPAGGQALVLIVRGREFHDNAEALGLSDAREDALNTGHSD